MPCIRAVKYIRCKGTDKISQIFFYDPSHSAEAMESFRVKVRTDLDTPCLNGSRTLPISTKASSAVGATAATRSVQI